MSGLKWLMVLVAITAFAQGLLFFFRVSREIGFGKDFHANFFRYQNSVFLFLGLILIFVCLAFLDWLISGSGEAIKPVRLS